MARRFSNIATRPARAAQIWQILVAKAHNRQTLTYGDLAELLDYDGAGVFAHILGHIFSYCAQNNLPPLTVLVVNQETGLPGFNTAMDLNAAREEVYRFDWFDIVPPSMNKLEKAFQDGDF
jgi:putative restriction endonuclease